MKKYKTISIAINLLLLLAFFHYALLEKEEILQEGQLILLELAPVDPRSLLQGDYMNLRYAIARNNRRDSIPKRGFVVVRLEANNVAKKIRIQEATTPIEDGEFLIEYTSPNQRGMDIGAESYFFQEGDAEKFEVAKYGGLRVDTKGNSVLIGLYDENKQKIE